MKTASMKILAIALLGAMALNTSSQAQTASPPAEAASTAEAWRENYAYTLGVQAYIFGFPYINLPTYRWQWVTQAPPPGPSHDMTPYAALNHFFHFRKLADASYRGGGGPNNDTFYSSAFVDLKDGPVILSHPDLGNRFFIFQLASFDGDNFASVGSRATGSKPGQFAIIGPNWTGLLPSGVTALPRSRTNSVYMLGRTLVDGPADTDTVHMLQNQYTLTPLRLWGKANIALPERRDVWKPFDAKEDPLADWKTMNRAMTEDPPEERLAELVKLFAKIGIGPGQDVDAQDEATKRGLARASVDGRKLIVDVTRSNNPFMGQKINGWSIPPKTFGRTGLADDFLLRAVMCHAGIITPWAEDAYATNTTTDVNGALVDGARKYVIHFAPGKVPQVKGFWSLTMYDSTFNLTPNPIDRYSIGNRTRGVKPDTDGGLTIYVQHESPGTDKESNWLPCPPSGIFTLTFRAYWPDKEVAEGKWSPPGVIPASDQETIDTLKLAYRWGYPLLATAINNENYAPVLNGFYNMKAVAGDKQRDTPGYNAETLYSAGAFDLSKEPLVLTIPPIDDRFYVFPLQDAWATLFAVIGTRTEGNAGGSYLLSGPGWNGTVPTGMKHFRCATSIGFIPGRTQVKSPADAQDVAKRLMDNYTLTPLSRWGKGPPNRNRDSLNEPLVQDENKNWNTQLTKFPITEYFNRLNALLVTNPPTPADAPVVERFARVGIGAGKTFDLNALSPAARDAIVEFGRNDIPETVKRIASRGLPEKVRPIIGRYGTDYQERYLMIFGGLGQNLQEDAVYIWLNQDQQGDKLDGNRRYVVRFEPGQLPPARAFWSVTLYDKNFFLAKDMPMDRHVLNNNSGMKSGPDGSLEIYLQADSPGAEKESNWLPVPRDEYFAILRLYWGEERLFNGQWKVPPVQLVR